MPGSINQECSFCRPCDLAALRLNNCFSLAMTAKTAAQYLVEVMLTHLILRGVAFLWCVENPTDQRPCLAAVSVLYGGPGDSRKSSLKSLDDVVLNMVDQTLSDSNVPRLSNWFNFRRTN